MTALSEESGAGNRNNDVFHNPVQAGVFSSTKDKGKISVNQNKGGRGKINKQSTANLTVGMLFFRGSVASPL
ncbi:hypothetical protein QQF64_027645 [Cirrhinus molitorella]|uniref:Uncharacterized protein n=1 Tax=Cirrhinus molitorella TaxID=172907 RepID=A0ABR3NDD2_9TELE